MAKFQILIVNNLITAQPVLRRLVKFLTPLITQGVNLVCEVCLYIKNVVNIEYKYTLGTMKCRAFI